MTKLYIQIQPNRVSLLEWECISALVDEIVTDNTLVEQYDTVDGDDNWPYKNLFFETPSPEKLWKMFYLNMRKKLENI